MTPVTILGIAVTILGVVVTILAGAVTYLAWKNGKTTRENTERILQAIKESAKLLALLILSETSEERKELAKRILEI